MHAALVSLAALRCQNDKNKLDIFLVKFIAGLKALYTFAFGSI